MDFNGVQPELRQADRLYRFEHLGIFPDTPSRFMTSLIASCSDGIFAFLRDCDARLPLSRPIVIIRDGRPILDMDVMEVAAGKWGIPLSMLIPAENSGGSVDGGQLLRSIIPLIRLSKAYIQSGSSARQNIDPLLSAGCQPFEDFASAVRAAQDVYGRYARVMLLLSGAIHTLSYLAGDPHPIRSNRQLSVVNLLHYDLLWLHRIALDDEAGMSALKAGTLPQEGDFAGAWAIFMTRYGHRGRDEIDLAQPRYKEMEKELIAQLMAISPEQTEKTARRPRGHSLTAPFGWAQQYYLNARFRYCFSAMYAFTHLRNELLQLADRAVAKGQIEAREVIWKLDLDGVLLLDQER